MLSVDIADEEDDFEEGDDDAADDDDQDVVDSSVVGPKQGIRTIVRRRTRRVKSKLSGQVPPSTRFSEYPTVFPCHR